MAPRWAWVPRSVPPQQILSLHVKCVGPQFRRPPKKLRLPRCCASPEFSYSLTLREERSGSPVSAFICWVCTKHAVSPQVLRLPRIFLFLNTTRLPRNAVTPQFLCASQKILRRQTNHSARFWRPKTSPQIHKIFTNFKPSKNRPKYSLYYIDPDEISKLSDILSDFLFSSLHLKWVFTNSTGV